RKVAALRDWVSAVNITDNQGASVRLASWAGSLAALAAGVEPVLQVTCRDRNRIALQSDLRRAHAAAALLPRLVRDPVRPPRPPGVGCPARPALGRHPGREGGRRGAVRAD